MTKSRRQASFIDAKVQGTLLLRAVLHWTLLMGGTFIVLLCWEFLTGGPHATLSACLEHMWIRYGPAFLILLALQPIVVYDTLKLSNRLAGPLFRLRRVTQSLIDGEWVTPIRFRSGDFCQDLAENFNILLSRIQHGPPANGEPAETREAESTAEATSER